MECKINELSAMWMRLNVMCVCKSVHDSLAVGVWRAAALHAKLTPQAMRVSVHRAQENDTTTESRSWITVPVSDNNTPLMSRWVTFYI